MEEVGMSLWKGTGKVRGRGLRSTIIGHLSELWSVYCSRDFMSLGEWGLKMRQTLVVGMKMASIGS